MAISPNGVVSPQFSEVRLLNCEGNQTASNWVEVASGSGIRSITDEPGFAIDSTNALRLTQSDATAVSGIVRYYNYNASGVDISGSDLWTMAVQWPDKPSRWTAGSGTVELCVSSNGAGTFTNNYLITLGGGTVTGLPTLGRQVWTWKTSNMTAGSGGANLKSITNIRLRLSTASATDSVIIQGIWVGRKARSLCSITFDDGWATQGLGANEACTIANAAGIPLTLYVIPELIDGSDGSTYLSETELEAIHYAGNAVCVHGTGPSGVGNLTDYDDHGLAHVTEAQAWVRNKGYEWEHYAYPGGAFNGPVLSVMGQVGMKTARTLNGISYDAGPPEVYASRGSYHLFSTNIGGFNERYQVNASPLSATTQTLAQAIANVDLAISKGDSIVFYGHKIGATVDSLHWSVSDFTALCEHIKKRQTEGALEVVTMPQMYTKLTDANRPATSSRIARV